jgi:hypothetical protein
MKLEICFTDFEVSNAYAHAGSISFKVLQRCSLTPLSQRTAKLPDLRSCSMSSQVPDDSADESGPALPCCDMGGIDIDDRDCEGATLICIDFASAGGQQVPCALCVQDHTNDVSFFAGAPRVFLLHESRL